MISSTNTHRILCICLLIGFTVFTNNCLAQKFDPYSGRSADFHGDLKRYFENSQAELLSRSKLLDSIETFEAKPAWNLKNLKLRLDLYEHFTVELKRHKIYWQLTYFNNKIDTTANSTKNKIEDAASVLETYLNATLIKCKLAAVTEEQIKKNQLNRYRYLLAQVKKDAIHTPSVGDVKIINTLSQTLLGGLDDRYNDVIDHIKALPVMDSAGKAFDPIREISLIKRNKDPDLRERGTKANLSAYDAHEEVFAATLIDIAREENATAKLYGYTNAPAEMYDARLQLSEADVKQLLNEFSSHAAVLQKYQQIQAQEIKQITGSQQVHSWDLAVPLGFLPEPQDMATAAKNILQALLPLGLEYVNHFSYLLNPANGEMNLTGSAKRVTEYTGLGYPGVPSTLYMRGFTGDISSMKTLIHEGGHVIHRQLMSDNHIVPTYSLGPSFLFESYAIFNSLLLFDELKKQSNTNTARAYYTKQLLICWLQNYSHRRRKELLNRIFTMAYQQAM